VQLNLDVPDALYTQVFLKQFVAVSVAGEGHAVVAAVRFKTRIASPLLALNTPKECIKRFVYSFQDILAAVIVR